nr:Ribosomal protein L1 domain containing protein [Haemonchus contortus]
MISSFRNTAMLSCSGVAVLDLLRPAAGDFTQLRGRKRALKQSLTRQQKLERRLKREEKEAARKQYTFMERINIRRMKNLLSPSQQFPGRLCREDEANLPDKPPTNIFIRSKVKTQFYSVAEALARHRVLQQPFIFNNPNAPVRLRLELNMSTERQTKMVTNSDEIVPVPYPFPHSEKRTILAFVNDPKLQEIAVESGAEIALGQDVIKKIIKGHFRTDDYDFCVAHVDMASYLLPLRGILRTKFPSRFNGGLGEDLPELIQKFKSGVKLSIKGDPVYPIWGLSNAVVGRLTMPEVEIEANIAAVIRSACAHRNAALGPFINRALLMTIPGEEHYALNVDQWLPVPTEEEIEKLEKRRSKKGKKKEEKKEGDDEELLTATA